MKTNTTIAITNLGVAGCVIVALLLTNSLWSFLGLFFMASKSKKKAVDATCPSCTTKFVVKVKEDED